jgi:hypothetical protein
MARVRKIPRHPKDKHFYLVDANFLSNKFIPYSRVTDLKEQSRVTRSQDWWLEIDAQLKAEKAIVYVLDVCIAESFRVLAKKYYENKYFRNSAEYKFARDALTDFLHLSPKTLKASRRSVRVHDISTSRDIVIAVDRFYGVFLKHKLTASVVDLLILATAKYLTDFYAIPSDRLFIVTLDNSLWRGSKKIPDVPTAFNPNAEGELAMKVFDA